MVLSTYDVSEEFFPECPSNGFCIYVYTTRRHLLQGVYECLFDISYLRQSHKLYTHSNLQSVGHINTIYIQYDICTYMQEYFFNCNKDMTFTWNDFCIS
jgi:hypothetical protein